MQPVTIMDGVFLGLVDGATAALEVQIVRIGQTTRLCWRPVGSDEPPRIIETAQPCPLLPPDRLAPTG